jgi:hypothetical protein
MDMPEAEANARLIAAAPDLYAALLQCQTLLSVLKYHDEADQGSLEEAIGVTTAKVSAALCLATEG